MTVAVTVDLVGAPNGRVWHIVALPKRTTTLCSWDVPENATVEEGLDPHVFSHKRRLVCSRCRKRLA